MKDKNKWITFKLAGLHTGKVIVQKKNIKLLLNRDTDDWGLVIPGHFEEMVIVTEESVKKHFKNETGKFSKSNKIEQ